MSKEPETIAPTTDGNEESSRMRVLGWFAFGVAVAAVGLLVGRELRNRYKFKRRTPYDFYANAGEGQSGEFGVGI